MNKMKFLTPLMLVVVVLLAGCKTKSVDGYAITGTVTNPNGDQLFLEQMTKAKLVVIDTTSIETDGSFAFEGALEEPGIFRVRDSKNKGQVIFLEKGSTLNLAFNTDDLLNYEVSGNDESQSIQEFTTFFNENNKKRQEFQQQAAAVKDDKQAVEAIRQEFISYEAKHKEDLKAMITNATSPYVGILMMSSVSPTEKKFYNDFAERVRLEIPNSDYGKDFLSTVEQINSRVAPPAIGEDMREISGESPDGKVFTLSELKGQYVLLDFWAGWCGPCRRENPNVVNAYNKYKDKGFTVFSVSLDKTKNKWVQAIEQDKLAWPYHVSDLKYWSSKPAKDYAVGSIPASFLISPDGKIVGKNLRGPALHQKLEEVLGAS